LLNYDFSEERRTVHWKKSRDSLHSIQRTQSPLFVQFRLINSKGQSPANQWNFLRHDQEGASIDKSMWEDFFFLFLSLFLTWQQFMCCVTVGTTKSWYFSRHYLVIIVTTQPWEDIVHHCLLLLLSWLRRESASQLAASGNSVTVKQNIEAHLVWDELSLIISGLSQCGLAPKQHTVITAVKLWQRPQVHKHSAWRHLNFCFF